VVAKNKVFVKLFVFFYKAMASFVFLDDAIPASIPPITYP